MKSFGNREIASCWAGISVGHGTDRGRAVLFYYFENVAVIGNWKTAKLNPEPTGVDLDHGWTKILNLRKFVLFVLYSCKKIFFLDSQNSRYQITS
jgi:hypothetical protein